MFYYTPFINANDFFRADQLQKSYKTFENALDLVKEAIQDEREDELFYDYLISLAPTKEEKDIITTIRDDERKHNKYFREIYAFYMGKTIPSSEESSFQKPQSYIEGIKKAKFGELGAVEKYRDIRAGIPDEYYRDMTFEILTDELKHAHKYDYILYLSLENNTANSQDAKAYWSTPRNFYRQMRQFTLSELAQYDGSVGNPAYVAVNGIVYDISNEAAWGGGSHFGLMAGKDLTQQFQSCHGSANILEMLPKVGILKT